MSKFLTYQEISLKLEDRSLIPIDKGDNYLTKSQVVSWFSNEDYDETKLNNVKGDNYFVTDDDIVQSPRYALHVILGSHVNSVNISVLGSFKPPRPTSDNTSDDNDVSPSSLSGGTIIDGPTKPGGGGVELVGSNFIKIGKSKAIAESSTVYIPAGARVNFSPSYDDGYKGDETINTIFSMDSERTVKIVSKEITTTHTHNNSGTVHVTFNKHNTKDTISYQVYHKYNNSECTIQTGDIDGTSATITTPTYGNNTSIVFLMNLASSLTPESKVYELSVNSSSNVTATAFQYDFTNTTELKAGGPMLDLNNIKSGWSVYITIN